MTAKTIFLRRLRPECVCRVCGYRHEAELWSIGAFLTPHFFVWHAPNPRELANRGSFLLVAVGRHLAHLTRGLCEIRNVRLLLKAYRMGDTAS